MTEVLFYHLTESKLEDALPPLVDKSVERGWRVAIQVKETARSDALDAHLWTFREDSFLPHGTDEAELAEDQPVLLTASAGQCQRRDRAFHCRRRRAAAGRCL